MLNKIEVGSRIKDLRGLLSQRELEGKIDFVQTYISEIETGKTKPSLEFLLSVSDFFDVSIDYILTGKEFIETEIEENAFSDVANNVKTHFAKNAINNISKSVSWIERLDQSKVVDICKIEEQLNKMAFSQLEQELLKASG